jgi:hypothetical protein
MTNAGVGALQKGMGLGASIGLEGINEVDEFLAGQVLRRSVVGKSAQSIPQWALTPTP